MYKISTWNLERPKSNTKKTKLAINKILEEDSDIIVLTETSNAVNLSSNYPYSLSTESYDRTPTEQWVTIWSKWPIIRQLRTIDSKRTICGIIESAFGNIILYGTIIPYHMAGVSGTRYGNLNYKAWEFHEIDLHAQSENWSELLKNNEGLPLIIAGDFNQTRFNNIGYGTKRVREILNQNLQNLELSCVTEIDFSENYLSKDPKKNSIRKNIDHICISNSLLNQFESYRVGAWNHFTLNGDYMSDHNGVYLKFKL
ncbi:MAG TPA: endonuclease/exonuclease/phosphatase family protein [Chitinophagales bacterium]|nr:endonuclease/exonuclease/phosphatase family protein [Chitinophagales bacterium]